MTYHSVSWHTSEDVKEVLYDMMFPSRSDPDLALRLQREKMTGKPVTIVTLAIQLHSN